MSLFIWSVSSDYCLFFQSVVIHTLVTVFWFCCWQVFVVSYVLSQSWSFSLYSLLCAPCGLQGCKNRPAPFRGRISYKVTKPGLTCLSYLSMLYIVLLFIRAPFYLLVIFVAMCSGFWLFWLSCQYLRSDWLERLLSGSLTLARGSSPKTPGRRVLYDFLALLYCFIVLLCVCVVLQPYVIYFLLLWHNVAYLCWKCR